MEISINRDVKGLYINVVAYGEEDIAEVIIKRKHDNIVPIWEPITIHPI